MSINPQLTTTAFVLDGYHITKNLGIVRGITVRSRSFIGTFGASLQTLFGGNITIYTELCEKARADAHRLMIEHAAQLGANTVIAVRYDANEIADEVTEVRKTENEVRQRCRVGVMFAPLFTQVSRGLRVNGSVEENRLRDRRQLLRNS